MGPVFSEGEKNEMTKQALKQVTQSKKAEWVSAREEKTPETYFFFPSKITWVSGIIECI